MLCIPPWRKTIFADLVTQCSQADAQHLSGVGPISIGQRQRVFQMQPFDLRGLVCLRPVPRPELPTAASRALR